MNDIFQKLLLSVLGLILGAAVPVITYEYRIVTLEIFKDKTEQDKFRRQDAELMLKDLELRLKEIESKIQSNRTLVQRECHRNNIQDESLKIHPLNDCNQDF